MGPYRKLKDADKLGSGASEQGKESKKTKTTEKTKVTEETTVVDPAIAVTTVKPGITPGQKEYTK